MDDHQWRTLYDGSRECRVTARITPMTDDVIGRRRQQREARKMAEKLRGMYYVSTFDGSAAESIMSGLNALSREAD